MPPKRKASLNVSKVTKAIRTGRSQPEASSSDNPQDGQPQPDHQQAFMAEVLRLQQRSEAMIAKMAEDSNARMTSIERRLDEVSNEKQFNAPSPSLPPNNTVNEQPVVHTHSQPGTSHQNFLSATNTVNGAAVSLVKEIVGGEVTQTEWPVYGHIDNDLKDRINKYEPIEMRDLLRDNGDSEERKEKGKKPKPLSEAEWRMAWNIFSSILLKAHPEHSDGIHSHWERVSEIMSLGGDWRRYDSDFRRSVYNGRGAWGKADMALQQICRLPAPISFDKNAKSNRSFKPFREFGDLPTGYCFNFHSKNGCKRQQCQYEHKCPHCKEHHKVSDCSSRPFRSNPKGFGGRGRGGRL